ncbi:hypothetical protein ACWCV5_25385 [Streptomyces tubercidicus]
MGPEQVLDGAGLPQQIALAGQRPAGGRGARRGGRGGDRRTVRAGAVRERAPAEADTAAEGDRPNRRVTLDTRMLNGMLKLRTQYGFRIAVSEIVGGDHSSRSRHYAGVAFDINHINGRHVGSGAPHRNLMAACKKLGATEVLGPGSAGHATHVHCGWPR